MAKDPAVLFYTSDFLSGVSLMSMKERGQYITLLCLQRERGHMTKEEITKAVGKLSGEVLSKFIQDDDGKYYNPRMEIEIQKRDAHCRKQKENISKRWNKKNGVVGIEPGNTMVDTVVLPLGNGNNNTNGIVSPVYKPISKDEVTLDVGPTPSVSPPPDPVAAVLADYLNRINPSASPYSLDELRGYAEEMGEAVCKRAFDIALDNKKATWRYVRAILRDKLSRGVKCLADWDALEEKRESGKSGGFEYDYGSMEGSL